MAKVTTNFMEVMLRTAFIGKTIYLEDDTPILIDDLNYEPRIRTVYITSGTESYKLNVDKYFDMDDGVRTRRQPQNRIKGRSVRNW